MMPLMALETVGWGVLMDNKDPVLYTVQDIKRIFKCGQRQAYELVKTPGFPSFRVGTKLLVEREALMKWISDLKKK